MTDTNGCGCEIPSVKFCNYDDGNTGNCENCSDMEGELQSCYETGLPEKGANDCAKYCFSNFTTVPFYEVWYEEPDLFNSASRLVYGDDFSDKTISNFTCAMPYELLDETTNNSKSSV